MSAAQSFVKEALAGLVHQFADPLACFRELIQNAVDAGSTEIEIRFTYVDGRLVVHVDDFGEGMDRAIIDGKLTRLFSSSKAGDRTKIGRFGIGFVSVFALEPEVVCVDTSRSGEHWRVIFNPDRSFTRVARSEPVDGTKIAIYKTMPEAEAVALASRAREVIAFWCRHVPAEIRVDGTSISRPFALDLPCTVASESGDTRMVAGYSVGDDSSIGYYNRGLTLLEERPGPFSGVHVKVWSPALEHTMTRDNVLRDEGHARALERARGLVEGPLRARLIAVLAEQAQALTLHGGEDLADRTMAQLLRHVRARAQLPEAAWTTPLVRCHHAGLVPLGALRTAAKAGRVYWASSPSPLTQALHGRGERVIAAREPSAGAAVELVALLAGQPVRWLDAALCTSVAVAEPASWPQLRMALMSLLAEVGVRPRAIALADLGYAGSQVATRAAIVQEDVGAVTAMEAIELTPGRRVAALVMHIGDPAVGSALALVQREPELAAYMLAKLVTLRRGLDVAMDLKLAAKAQELRWRRMI